MSRGGGGRLILAGGLVSGLGFGIRFLARFVFLIIAGRLFGAALFGAYSIGVAMVEVAVLLGGLGTRWLIFPWLDGHDEAGGRPRAHLLLDVALLVTAASAAIAGVAMLAALSLQLSSRTADAILWLAPMIVVQALIELFLAVTRWTGTMRPEVIGKSLIQPYVGVAAALLAYQVEASRLGLLISYIAGSCAALGYAIFALVRAIGPLGAARYRPALDLFHARRASIAANSGSDLIEALFTRADIYAAGLLFGESGAGIYAMAKQLAIAVRQVRQSFDGMLVPLMARTLAVAEDGTLPQALSSTARLILIVQLPLIILFITGGTILLEMFGTRFLAAEGALVALALAEGVQGTLGIGDLLFAFRRPGLGIAVTAASSFAGLALILALAPPLGLTGIGLAMLGAYGLRAALRRHFLSTRLAIASPAGALVMPSLAAGAAIALGMMFPSPVLGTGAALLAYVSIVAAWLIGTGQQLAPSGVQSSDTSE